MKMAGAMYFGGIGLIGLGLWTVNPVLAIGAIFFIIGNGTIESDHLTRVSRRSDEQFKEIRDEISDLKYR